MGLIDNGDCNDKIENIIASLFCVATCRCSFPRMKTADCRTYLVGLPLTWGRVDVHASFASTDGLVYKIYVRVTPASTGHNGDLYVGLTPASTGHNEDPFV